EPARVSSGPDERGAFDPHESDRPQVSDLSCSSGRSDRLGICSGRAPSQKSRRATSVRPSVASLCRRSMRPGLSTTSFDGGASGPPPGAIEPRRNRPMEVTLPEAGSASANLVSLVHRVWAEEAAKAGIDLSHFDPGSALADRLAWAESLGLE